MKEPEEKVPRASHATVDTEAWDRTNATSRPFNENDWMKYLSWLPKEVRSENAASRPWLV